MSFQLDNSEVTELSGEVVSTIFHSLESGYSVIRLADDQGNERTVTGTFPAVTAGQLLKFSGSWAKHKDYGLQFKVDKFEYILPTGKLGIQRFLASGIIPGIGTKLAKNIVDHFGDRTIEILDEKPQRLLEIDKIGAKKVKLIAEGWQSAMGDRAQYIFLQELGLTPQFCRKLISRYGSKAAQVVKSNPYRLAEDIDGVGFLKSDKIASELGIEPHATPRLLAGIVYSINQLTTQGHCCYPKELLITETAQMLKIEEDILYPALELALKTKQIMTDGEFIYPARLFNAERELPRHLFRICDVKSFAAKAIREIKPADNLTLNQEQLEAIDHVSSSPISIVTGGPGVGKTTVLGELVRRAKKAKLNIMLAAPTGRATKRLSEATGTTAKTIHRLLIFDPITNEFMHDAINPLDCDLLIVDEVSMLDLPLALALFKAIRQGTAVVLVGDADQLPSVGPGTVLADLINCKEFAVTQLKQVYRQSETSMIIRNAHRVNEGLLPISVRSNELNDFYWINCETPEHALELVSKLISERIPQRYGFSSATDIQILSPMNRGLCGTTALNEMLQNLLNGGELPEIKRGERLFKLHDKVMQIVNNYDKAIYNGDTGRITKVDIKKKELTVVFEGATEPQLYPYDELDELTLAYAVTVHKSQGSEFPVVILPILPQHFMMLQRNLLYTGMTRARKLLIIIGNEKAVSMAVNNVSAAPRFGNLRAEITKVWQKSNK